MWCVEHISYPRIATGGAPVGGDWIATEKIHGGQLVLGFDGRAVHVGKRKAWLRPDEPFFGWQLLRDRFTLAAEAALSRGGTAVRIFGELYGGAYPHPDVPAAPGMAPVQTGVWYSPAVRYALFDVLRHTAPDDPGVFLPYAEVAAIAADAGLDVVPLIVRGTRTAVDAVPVRFPTRMPQVLGLPPLDDNLAEGVVLRPDAPMAPADRPIRKLKIAEFDEHRFSESRKWDPWLHLSAADLRELATAMVNGPRLASARSKVGPETGDDLLDEVTLDVMIDLAEAFPAAMGALSATDEAALQAHIRSHAGALGPPLADQR
jgi:Rnl2 family RNA ligase